MDGDEKPFAVDRAKNGRAGCKRCKGKLEKGTLRIARMVPNHFSDSGGTMKNWFHTACLFESFAKARATTRIIETPEDDLEGWDDLADEDKAEVQKLVDETNANRSQKPETKKKVAAKSPKVTTKNAASPSVGASPSKVHKKSPEKLSQNIDSQSGKDDGRFSHRDHSFRQFRQVCAILAETPSYNDKTSYLKKFLENGSSGDKFEGDVALWIRMLLPGAKKRVYNLANKQLVKLFSRIFDAKLDDMMEDLNLGDVASTIKKFFEESTKCAPNPKSKLTMQQVDEFLEELTGVRTEEEQTFVFKKIVKKCTSNDLQMIIRLIKHDLRINAGPPNILAALHPDANEAFENSRDLDSVVARVVEVKLSGKKDINSLDIGISLMTPVKPMLAEVCKSVDQAMARCPDGMLSEVKYDGERVQVHKRGKEFKYFSRSLKAVVPNKVKELAEFIPKAFPHGRDLIIDSEILLMDTVKSKPLPFGTLGVHKKAAFKDACVCLFVFDCLYYNGEVLLGKSMKERRRILHENMTEVPNRVVFSETKLIEHKKELEEMIARVLSEGLEGLVLKPIKSIYEPGKRHWLKVKKDYLCGGKMADTADLVPLGAYYGTGNKGGIMSIFLMCCWDPVKKRWTTVTKVHSGLTDEELEKIQTELKMQRFNKDVDQLPNWISIPSTHLPAFIAEDPSEMPVWEIAGAEFTKHDVHTAGYSIRFPRIVKFRDDKSYKEATNLQELKTLYDNSRTGDIDKISSMISSDAGPSTSKTAFLYKTENKKQSPTKMGNLDKFIKRMPKSDEDIKEKIVSPSKQRGIDSNIDKKPKSGEPKSKDDVHGQTKRTEKENGKHKNKASSLVPTKRSASNNVPVNNKKRKCVIQKPLPDVFASIHMVIPEWASTRHEVLTRYFIAYGGTLLGEHRTLGATHRLYDEAHLPKASSSPWVTVAWLWDSIREQKLQPVERYSPKL